MTDRLTESQLARLPSEIGKPAYERSARKAGIVHLGVGAFHRAHQAWYTEQAMSRSSGDWGIVGASLRSLQVAQDLNPQDGLYTVVEREGESTHCRVVGAIQRVLVAPEDPEALIEQLADPAIRLVTLTITEKGYLYSPERDGLARDNAALQREIERFPSRPETAIGYLAAALSRRRRGGAGGLTLLSCDNLPHNGKILSRVLEDYIGEVEPGLSAWIKEHVSFPCSMVDRIVPASTAEDLAELESVLGCRDLAAVFTEPFSQWVIEDNFVRGAPPWEAVGALYTDDVTPFETMKLRLLNGSHSLMAYLGYLAGYDYVHQVMANPQFSTLVRRFMDAEAQPTLKVPTGFDIENYKDALCQRFANSALNHRLYQIAQDGSQKIPQRWLAPARDLLAMGKPADVLALALAGWIRYLSGRRDGGDTFSVDDPLAEKLSQRLQAADPVAAIMGAEEVFGNFAVAHPDFVTTVKHFYREITMVGVSGAVDGLLANKR